MSTGGWIIMTAAVAGITALLVWCIYKVISTPGSSEHMHAQTDIDPGDQEE
ncbi:MAG: hypothetical protein QGH94_18750 [Phycisphaerae bacterium]|jgi:hypothetical protein|nr:hypothetical protein [Phycisphaerae bacterium]